MWFALLAAASAAELGPGLFLPSATPLDAGETRAGGIGIVGYDGPATLALGGARASTGGRHGWAVEGVAVGSARFGVLGVGVRRLVVAGERFRLAPWGLVGAAGAWKGGALGFAVGGVALEGGGDRVRVDASLPLVVAGAPGLTPPVAVGLPVALGTVGLSVRAGAHTVRAGLESLGSPTLGWRYLGCSWYGGVHVGGLMLGAAPAVGVDAGVRW